jgi:hypothetical protein
MKMTYLIPIIILISIGVFYACKQKPKEKTDKEQLEEILNDPRINSREVGEREGIKYFQYMENDKTGFRDLDGNIVIKAIYESAEMFSEGHSAVDFDGKWGLINEKGEYVIEPQYDFLGGLHNGLVGFRQNDLTGFLDVNGNIVIEPQFHWVDEFSEGFCVVSTDWRTEKPRLYGYIDTTGKIAIDYKYQHAIKFEDGIGKVQLNNLWGAVDKDGNEVVEIKHKYTNEY